MLPELAGALTLSRPHFLSFCFCLSPVLPTPPPPHPLRALACCCFCLLCTMAHVMHVFLHPSSVCAMAVRNCLECQHAQVKHSQDVQSQGSAPPAPGTVLRSAKSVSAQASGSMSPLLWHLKWEIGLSTPLY